MVFWVFVFPVLMALALGIAFRTRGDEPIPVAVQNGPGATALVEMLSDTTDLNLIVVAPSSALTALRDGLAHLVVVPGNPPTYRYDPARPESRLSRLLVDRALSDAADPASRSQQADLPPVVGPLIMREFSVSGLLNQSVFPAVSLKITNARAWSATTVRSRPCSSSSVFSRLR